MIFKFKKSKLVVDCFTYSRAAYELHKIRKAVLYYPETIKKMSPSYDQYDIRTNIKLQSPTIKKCTGINGLYTKGAIMPLWLDVILDAKSCTEGKTQLVTADHWWMERIVSHHNKQYSPLFDGYHHLKIGSVWNNVEKTGLKFIWMPATYNMEEYGLNEKIIIPPGLTYYDEQPQTNINMFVKKDTEHFVLRAGTPLIQIIPLTDKDVEWKCHLVSHEEFIKKNEIPPDMTMHYEGTRNNRYRKDKDLAKKLDAEEKKGKCPFGFGR